MRGKKEKEKEKKSKQHNVIAVISGIQLLYLYFNKRSGDEQRDRDSGLCSSIAGF